MTKKQAVKTIDIHGKEYVPVPERVRIFHENHEKGAIKTEILSMNEKVVVMKTTVWPDTNMQDRYFTGIAYEKEGSSNVNKTSFIENCETSAVGRALGFLNIGLIDDIASADEVIHAKSQQGGSSFTTSSVDDNGEKVDLINFGKHSGQPWSKVPDSYINWLIDNSTKADIKKKAMEERTKRITNVMSDNPPADAPF